MSEKPRCETLLKIRRAQAKAELLVILREHEARGEWPDMAALAIRFRLSKSAVHKMRQELAALGLTVDPQRRRLERTDETLLPDLADRVAAVLDAKFRKWESGEIHCLNEDELRRILP